MPALGFGLWAFGALKVAFFLGKLWKDGINKGALLVLVPVIKKIKVVHKFLRANHISIVSKHRVVSSYSR